MTSLHLTRASVLFAILLSARALSAASFWQVDVNVDMTDAGRQRTHPLPDKPAYYYPVVAGYRELGAAIAGEEPPPERDVLHRLAVALANQGYIASHGVASDHRSRKGESETLALSPRPSLILVLHWGRMNPNQLDLTINPDLPNQVIANEGQMLALVAGNAVNDLDLDFEREAVMQGIEQNRYFVTVAAYDFDAYFVRHKKVLLWAAKMSLPSDGVAIAAAMPALITGGGPLFGRETRRPKWIALPVVPPGRVVVGEPRLMEYHDAPLPPPAPAPAANHQP